MKNFFNKKKFLSAIGIAIVLVGGVFLFWRLRKMENPDLEMTLSAASEIGEKAERKLMVAIENPKGDARDTSGRYERGDIVLIFPADHQFSLAEKEGFLIVKMNLSSKQAEILTQSLLEEKNIVEKIKMSLGGEASKLEGKTLKRRRFSVDLSQIGISPDDQKGRELEDVFDWKVLKAK